MISFRKSIIFPAVKNCRSPSDNGNVTIHTIHSLTDLGIVMFVDKDIAVTAVGKPQMAILKDQCKIRRDANRSVYDAVPTDDSDSCFILNGFLYFIGDICLAVFHKFTHDNLHFIKTLISDR